jgi:hypothetical protein
MVVKTANHTCSSSLKSPMHHSSMGLPLQEISTLAEEPMTVENGIFVSGTYLNTCCKGSFKEQQKEDSSRHTKNYSNQSSKISHW